MNTSLNLLSGEATICIAFLKKSQNCNAKIFCIICNLSHHKYNNKNFSVVCKK